MRPLDEFIAKMTAVTTDRVCIDGGLRATSEIDDIFGERTAAQDCKSHKGIRAIRSSWHRFVRSGLTAMGRGSVRFDLPTAFVAGDLCRGHPVNMLNQRFLAASRLFLREYCGLTSAQPLVHEWIPRALRTTRATFPRIRGAAYAMAALIASRAVPPRCVAGYSARRAIRQSIACPIGRGSPNSPGINISY